MVAGRDVVVFRGLDGKRGWFRVADAVPYRSDDPQHALLQGTLYHVNGRWFAMHDLSFEADELALQDAIMWLLSGGLLIPEALNEFAEQTRIR
jgi:hypothetical protein